MLIVKVGTPAPLFRAEGYARGEEAAIQVDLAAYRGRWVVLFFYPRAMTSGCTAEACHFRDLRTEFEKVGAQRMGISVDPVSKQKQFSDKHDFDYPLLSDGDGSVARAYGVTPGLLSFIRPVKRTTFVIGTDGLILDVINSETDMQVHADRALRTLSGA